MPADVLIIFAPRVAFTTRIAPFELEMDAVPDVFIRAAAPADGVIVNRLGIALAIFNADCPVLCLYQATKLAMLHIGYRCLIRADTREENIIAGGLQHFNPQHVQAFIFGGIGPCCWVPEYDDKPEILDVHNQHSSLLARCLGRTTRSPAGAGYVSVDLYKLAWELLLSAGVRQENISWDTRCTCCAAAGQPLFWSHTRFRAGGQGSVDGRNLSLAWLA